jgi:hypothetical protein
VVETTDPRVVVLVEGASDAAAVATLARTWAVPAVVHVLGGVTNTRSHARRLRSGGAPVLLGVCDAGEQRFLERVDPPLDGVYVCDRDLEDELIRAAGTDVVLEVLDELGDLARLRTFQGQPEWRGRPLHDQLRRFAGTRSGRKQLLAGSLAARLDPGSTPEVLARLLRRLGSPSVV